MSYERVKQALDAIGHTELYMHHFQQRKLNDNSVDICLKHTSLRSALKMTIPLETHRNQFVEAFTNPLSNESAINEVVNSNLVSYVASSVSNTDSIKLLTETETHYSESKSKEDSKFITTTNPNLVEKDDIIAANDKDSPSESERNSGIDISNSTSNSSTAKVSNIPIKNIDTHVAHDIVLQQIQQIQPKLTSTEFKDGQTSKVSSKSSDKNDVDKNSNPSSNVVNASSMFATFSYQNVALILDLASKSSTIRNRLQNLVKMSEQEPNISANSANEIHWFHVLALLIIVLSINFLLSFIVGIIVTIIHIVYYLLLALAIYYIVFRTKIVWVVAERLFDKPNNQTETDPRKSE